MEHGRFPYSPIVDRPPLRWPNGARVAMWFIPNIEYIHFDKLFAASHAKMVPPDIINYSQYDYGNRVAIFRLMDVLDRHGIRATVALNADVCDVYPAIIREGRRRNWEWMGHGQTNGQRLNGLPEDEERRIIGDALRVIEAATGTRPRGWLGPGLEENPRTPDYLKAAGLDYVADWCNDDQPYPMRTDHGTLYSIPYSTEINDVLVFPAHSPHEFTRRIKDQFDVLYEEGARSARVMAIAVHPGKVAVPHRIRHLAEALEHISRRDHVWWATGGEIIDAYKSAVA
jgi:peptidoglycan/xylan/chitin deacetylase (PgdA/CDA1 family)